MTWSAARSILCVRLDAMGDVLMTTPALKAVYGNGARRVTLLTSSSAATCATHIPEVSDVIVYDSPWMKSSVLGSCAGTDRYMLDLLSSRSFDAAVIFTVFSQSALPAALMCRLARIPLRLAFCRENPYQLLTDWVIETEPEQGIRHEVERQLHLVAQVGWRTDDDRLSLNVCESARRTIDDLRLRHSLEGRWILVHPGASAPSRRYPPPLFARAAELLVEAGFRIVLTGSDAERDIVDLIRSTIEGRSLSLAGRLSFAEFAALVEAAPLILTNNTGPAHIAAAVGTPVVDLYALTNPQHTPWRTPSIVLSHDVPCRNCFKSVCPQQHQHCLSLIEPHSVADACCALWERCWENREDSQSHAYFGNQCSIP
jgi:lipopolysaccharide heptosyltransferase II